MDIANATEICENTELLQQKISNIVFKNMNFKIRNNLAFEQRTALKELPQSTENKVYSYSKGIGFVIHNKKEAIRKTDQQIGESVLSNTYKVTNTYKSLKLELISNFILPILFHHVFMES